MLSVITLVQVFLYYNNWNATALKHNLNGVHLTKGKGAFHELLSFVPNGEKRLKHIPGPFPLNGRKMVAAGSCENYLVFESTCGHEAHAVSQGYFTLSIFFVKGILVTFQCLCNILRSIQFSIVNEAIQRRVKP